MNKTRWIGNLGAMAVMILISFLPGVGGTFALPLALIGKGLRALSLSGTAGNIAAIVLYILVSLLPLLLLLKGKRHKEDVLLLLTSDAMFYALYYIINPGLRPVILSGDVGTLVCEGAVYSVFLAWAVIRLVRYCENTGTEKIYRVLRILLIACAALCIFAGFGGGFRDFRQNIASVREANTMPGLNLMPTYVFTFLNFAAAAVEYGLTAWVLLLGAELVADIKKDPYGEDCCTAAAYTGKWCRISLITIMLVTMALNLGQMLLAANLHNLSVQVRLPVLSITIVLVMLAVTGLLRKGRQLKEDNDLFI